MKPIKQLLLLIALIVTGNLLHAQDLLNVVPKDVIFIGTVDINQLNTKAKFNQLTKLPFIDDIAKSMASKIFKDTVQANRSQYLDFSRYGINTKSKVNFYYTGAGKVNYAAMLVSLTSEQDFANFATVLMVDTTPDPIVVKNNYKYARKNGMTIVWNTKQAVLLWASINAMYKDSINKALQDKYYANKYPPVDTSAYIIADSIASVPAPIEEEMTVDPPAVPEDNYDSSTNTDTYSYNDTYPPTDSIAAPAYEEPYEDPYTKLYAQADSICNIALNEWYTTQLATLLEDKGTNSLARDPEYIKFVKNNPDAAFVFDYGAFINTYLDTLMGRQYMMMKNLPFGNIVDWFKHTKVFARIDFNKDDVQLSVDMKHGEQLADIYKEIKKKSISPAFLKYIDKDAMGYCAMGIDIKGVSKGIGTVLKKTLPLVPDYGDIAVSAMDVLDIIVDEQALYNILTGDIAFSFNGMKSTKVIRKSYKYDDDFNSTETMDTVYENQPEMQLMLGVGNKDDVNKIIKLLVSTKLLRQDGNVYGFEKGSSALPVYLSVHDNILFLSNNKAYIQNPVAYAPEKQFSKEHAKMFSANTTVCYVNTAKIMEYFARDTTNRYRKTFADASLFQELKMISASKKDYSNMKLTIKMKETSDNSLTDIINYINAAYLNKKENAPRYE
jgi:hypothetical protein